MSLQSHVGSFNAGTGILGSTIVITGVGFLPKVVFFWWSGRSESTDTIGRASSSRGFGAAASASDRRAVTSRSIDAAAAADTYAGHDAAACIVTSTNTAIDGALDLQSMDADGFTLVVDDVMPRDLRVHYLALGGDSLTDIATGQFQEAAATGDQDVTSLSFQPDSVLFFSSGRTVAPPVGQGNNPLMIGAATGSSNQGVWCGRSRNAQSTIVADTYCTAGECIALISSTASTVTCRADFSQFLSNGFRINWAEVTAGGRYIFYVALKGGNYRVDNLLTQTDTVTDIVESGFGFQPSSALFVSSGKIESTSDTTQADDKLSIGAFSGLTARGAQGTLDENALADSEVTTAIELDEVYVNIAADSTVQGLMDVKSVDSDGFTMIMDDADPAQAFVWYMAFGSAAGAFTVSVSETVTLTESTTVLVSAPQVSAGETVTLSESATASVTISVTASETVTLSETVSQELGTTVVASETVTLTESVTAATSAPQVSASETITLTEAQTVAIVSAGDFVITVNETVTLSEATAEVLISFVAASETVTLTEAVSAFVTISLSVAETVTLSENVTGQLETTISAAETVTLSEAVSQQLLITVAASETLTLTETATAAPLLLAGVSVGETVTLADLATIAVIAAAAVAVMPNNAAYAGFRDKRAMAKGRN